MKSQVPTIADATVIQLKHPDGEAPPPPPPPSAGPPPKMPSAHRRVRRDEIDAAQDLVTQARSILEAACTQVDDMISSARDIIVKAEGQAASIIEEAQVAAQRITGEARTQASSIEQASISISQQFTPEGDPPAPQKKSFAAMWARAGEEVGSVDDFIEAFERPSADDLAKKLASRWRQS